MTIYLSIYYPGDFVIFNWTIFINFFGTILVCALIGSLYYVYKIIKLELANVLSN